MNISPLHFLRHRAWQHHAPTGVFWYGHGVAMPQSVKIISTKVNHADLGHGSKIQHFALQFIATTDYSKYGFFQQISGKTGKIR